MNHYGFGREAPLVVAVANRAIVGSHDFHAVLNRSATVAARWAAEKGPRLP
ncbi:MAG: hypothetical protein ABI836_03190 [Gemmatimonadota bacterium]